MENRLSRNIIISSGKFDNEKEYWQTKLAEELTFSSFACETGREHPGQDGKNVFRFQFPGNITTELLQIGNNSEYGIFIILLAGLSCLLHKYTGNEDIIIGAPVFKQEQSGIYINHLLALRNRVQGEMSFKDLLNQVKNTVTEANENMNYPFDELVKELSLPEDKIHLRLFDVLLCLKNIHEDIQAEIRKYGTVFSFTMEPATIIGEIEYDSSLFNEASIDSLYKHLLNCLLLLIQYPSREIAALEILSGEEKQRLLVDLNQTFEDYQEHKTLHELFADQVERTPDSVAVIFEKQELTYRELKQASARLAGLLRNRGVRAGEIVGIMAERSLDLVIAILAVLQAGAACLLIDSDAPLERTVFMLGDCRVSLLSTDRNIFKKHSFLKLKNFKHVEPTVHITGLREQIADMDSLPMPDRSFIDYKRYDHYIGDPMVKNTYITMQATRGCPFNCAYCHKIWPKSHVFRSAENIFAEVLLYYNMGVRRFSFVDDVFNLNIKNSSKFFHTVIEKGLDIQLFFPSGLRGDILTEEYIDMMVDAGAVLFGMALETASPRLQKLIGKNLNIEKLRKNVEYVCKKHPQVIFEFQTMVGFPTETKEEAMLTLDFIKSLEWLHFPYINILRIYTNTDMEKIALENGINREQILNSEGLAYHQLPETLPFDKKFMTTYQNDFLNNYFLSKERLKHLLPYQAKVLTRDELVQKYNSYLPYDIHRLEDLLQLVKISEDELAIETFLPEDLMLVPDLDEKISRHFPHKKPDQDALRVLLLDLSQFFAEAGEILYDLAEPPLGLNSLLTYLLRTFGSRVNGRIAKAKFDFANYDELKKLIHDFKPDLIGLRTLTFYKEFFFKTASLIRRWGIDVPIISGGPYATSNYKEVLKNSGVDIVVLGEGEVTFTELIGKILDNEKKLPGEDVLKEIKGISFIPQKLVSREGFSREIILIDEPSGESSEPSWDDPTINNSSSDPAFVIFTSGSTGAPKGVVLHHKGINNHVFTKIRELDLQRSDIFCQNLNITFVASLWQFFAPLFIGAPLHVYPMEILLDPYEFFKKIETDMATVVEVAPSFLHAYLELLEAGKVQLILKNLRRLVLTGEKVTPSLVNRFYKKYEIALVNAYGQSECSDDTLHYKIPYNTGTAVVPIGKPANNTRIFILGRDNRLKPIGAPGELHISGAGLAAGYLNNPTLTSNRFVPNPYQPTEHIYRTGDLTRMSDEGDVLFLGRMDQQVKIRGYRIELEEIENQLLKHGAVDKAVVLAKGDEENKYLCAYVVLKAGDGRTAALYTTDRQEHGEKADIDFTDIKNFLSRDLPDYMMPTHYIAIDHIPRTPGGKLDRKKLPDPDDLLKRSVINPARDDLEIKLNKIWSQVLKLDQQMIGLDGNFFELGGNSLRAVSVIAEINKNLDVDIPMTALFDNPTIAQLAGYLKAAKKVQPSFISAVEKREYYTAASAQKRMYATVQADPMSHNFNHPIVLRFESQLDRDKIQATFQELIDRHESFRTSFDIIGLELAQIVHDSIKFEIDLYHVDAGNNDEEIGNIIKDFCQPFDLAKAPLFRVGFIVGKKQLSTLMINIHHIICDAVSLDIISRDFIALYEGKEIPALRLQYKDYAGWQNGDEAGEALKIQGEYWLELFAGTIPVLNLPADWAVGTGDKFTGGIVELEIGEDETSALKQIARDDGITLFNVLLAIYNVWLAKICEQDDIVVGIPVSGRTHHDLRYVVGVFVNVLALRNKMAGEKTFRDFLEIVSENTLKAYKNQDYPFDELAAKAGKTNTPLVGTEFFIHDPEGQTRENFKNLEEGNREGNREDNIKQVLNEIRFSERVDISLIGNVIGNRIVGEFHYKTAIFRRPTIERMGRYFINIIRSVIKNTDIRLNEIELLSADDKKRIAAAAEKNREVFAEFKTESFGETF